MTGDQKKEVLALWQNGKYESLYVYEYKDGNFVLLTPDFDFEWYDGSVTKEFAFNAPDGEIQLSDLDEDGVPEVWLPRENEYVAYKWDGSQYIIWKTQSRPFGQYKHFIDL